MLLFLVFLFGMILQSGLNCLYCWLQKLALPCLLRLLMPVVYIDTYWCLPLTRLSEPKSTIHLESSVFSFFSFFFLGIELSWRSSRSQTRTTPKTHPTVTSLESLPFLFLPMASTQVGCVLLYLAFWICCTSFVHLFSDFALNPSLQFICKCKSTVNTSKCTNLQNSYSGVAIFVRFVVDSVAWV